MRLHNLNNKKLILQLEDKIEHLSSANDGLRTYNITITRILDTIRGNYVAHAVRTKALCELLDCTPEEIVEKVKELKNTPL